MVIAHVILYVKFYSSDEISFTSIPGTPSKYEYSFEAGIDPLQGLFRVVNLAIQSLKFPLSLPQTLGPSIWFTTR